MIQGGEHLRLAMESSEAFRVLHERIGQHLQGIVSFEGRVVRAPDLAHAAFT
jgi:hypothetical protein